MAQLYAQDPTTPQPTPAPASDFTAKRSKFLTSFAALDPDAKLDDARLESILTDDTKRDEFVQYVGQLNPKFKMSGQELTDALGYKKKVQSVGGGQSSAAMPATASVVANGLPQDEPFMEVAPGPVGQPEPLPYDAMGEAANILGLPASQQEQVIPASFVGPRPAGAYQKRDDAGTVAEGAQYLSPASVAGQLNDDEQPLPAQDSFLSAVGKNIGNIPGDLVRAGGNALDALGDFNQRFLTPESDVAPGYESQVGVVTDGKASDRMGAAMRDTGESMKFEIAANAKQSVLDNPTNGAAWGNLFGQGVNSIAQVGAASLVGGPLAGATMGGALGISSTKDAAREAGLSETEALYTSMALAPVVGALEEMGMGFITKNKAVTGLLTKTIVGRAVAAGGGKLSETALAKAAASLMPEIVKRAVSGAGGEAVTEFLQAEAEGIAKLTADKIRGNDSAPAGKGRYGTTAFEALVKSPIEQGIGGALGGGFAGGLHSVATRQPSTNPKVAARQRQPEGTKPVAAHLTLAQLQGRTVLVRDDAGMTQMGAVHNIVGKGENRAIVIKDANGKLSRHAQGQVWVNDSSAPAANPTTPTNPAPTPALPATPRTDPGPTADPAPTNSRPYAAELNTQNPGGFNSASAGGNSAVAGPTLGELVPETATEAAPLDLTMSGQPVRAFRNDEGDVELHHAEGQISVLDKGQQFDHPAADFLLDAPTTVPQSGGTILRRENSANPNAIKPGDPVNVGGVTLPIEDVLRSKSGQIEALMVEGKNGSRIIEADTPDGKAVLAELNAREANVLKSEPIEQPADNESQPKIGPTSQPIEVQGRNNFASAKPVPTYGTPSANREAGAFIKDGQTYTRQEPISSRAVQGNESTATFADGVNVPVRYALIEADELQTFHTGGSQNLTHFIPESQPKNRSAAFDQASQKSIGDIAANPDVAQLGQAPTAYAGAPVVNARGEVIQGNGRSEGIRQHYRQDGKTYRTGIMKAAQAVGIDPAQAAAMKNPVLVRIADVSDARASELGNYANTESGIAHRLNPKQAAELQLDSPAAKRQAALDKINERRTQQGAPRSVEEYTTDYYPIRAGEPESIRKTGQEALKDLEKTEQRGRKRLQPDNGRDNGGNSTVPAQAQSLGQLNRGAATITQLGISPDLREKGICNFVGKVINSAHGLATLAQAMRDPRFETFKYYFVKTLPDGKQEIVGERTISSRMAGTTPAFPNGVDSIAWLKEQMAGCQADGYWCQHNHPSGHVQPSEADLEFTKYVMSQVSGFKGHIIINHKKYSVLGAWDGDMQGNVRVDANLPLKGQRDPATGELTPDPLLAPSLPGPLLGRAIGSPDDMAAVAKEVETTPGFVVIIGRGADGTVRATGHISLETLVRAGKGGINRAEAAIRKFQSDSGSPQVMLAGLPKSTGNPRMYYPRAADSSHYGVSASDLGLLIKRGILLDVVDARGKALSATYRHPGGWADFNRAPRVWEKTAPYGVSENDMADYRTVLESYAEEGTVGTKAMAARFHEDVGSPAETGLSDLDLKELVKEVQQNAGLVLTQKPGKQAKKVRRHAERYDAGTRQSFTEDEAKYMPRKVVENRADADAYIRQVGIENAYAVALDKPDGITPAAHIEIQEAVALAYRKLSDEAARAGNKELAEEMWGRSKDARAAKISKLTEAGQTLAQVAGFVAEAPDSVLDLAIKETEKQRKPKLRKAEKAGARVADIATKARQAAMRDALNSPAVVKAREGVTGTEGNSATEPEPKGWGAKNTVFTKASAVAAKEALRKLGLSTVVPPELVHFVGYHIEAAIRAGGEHSFATISARVVREVGAKVKPMLPAAYERARAVYVKKGGADKGFTSSANVAALVAPAAVKTGMKSLGTTLDRIAREQAAGIGAKGKSLADRFIAEGGLSPKYAATYAAAIEKEFTAQVNARKATLRTKLLTFSTRILLGRNAATAVDKLLTTLNLAVDPASAADLLKAQLNLPDISPAQADHFVKLSERVRAAKSPNERADRVQDLMKALGQIEKLDWREVAQSTWYASILSNPLTHVTNITANAKQMLAEGLISTLHTWADTGSLAAATGPARGAAKAQRRAIAEATRIITTGYTGTQSEKFGHNNVLENNTFAGGKANPINGLKFVGRALVGEDAYFNMTLRGMRSQEVALKNAFREVSRDAAMSGQKLRGKALYERAWATAMGTLYGIPDLVAASESQADAEALTGTVRQSRINELVNQAVQGKQDEWARVADAEALTGVDRQQRIGELQEMEQPADLVADAKKHAEIYTYNNPLEGRLGAMGDLLAKLGELPVGGVKVFRFIVPFTKILTNVQGRSLEWAGIGFVRAIKGGTGSQTYQGGKFYREYTAEDREKAFLRSTLGVVSALALWSLAKSGQLIITGNYLGDKDKDEERPANSIKWGNGLFTSYKGDSMEIILAAIGNLVAWQTKEEKAGRKPDMGKRLAVLVGMTSVYTLEMGPVRGVEDFNRNVMGMIKNPDRAGSYAAKFGANTAKGFIPWSAAAQQVLKTANILNDANQKETASDNAWQAAYNSLVQDVPVVRDELGDAVDVLGDELKLDSNRLWGWMPEGREPQDQRNLDWLSEHDLIPTRSKVTDDNLTVFVDGKLRPMNAKEFYRFQVVRGETFKQGLREAMTRPSELPGLPAATRNAILAAGPEANLSLRQLDLLTAKKVVARLRKAAVVAGKQVVLESHQPKPATK